MTAALLPIDQPAPAAEGVQKTCLIPVDHRHWYCAIFCGLTGVCRKTVVFSTARSHHRAAASRPDKECHARRDLSEGIHAGPHNGNQERELTIVAERMGAEVTIYRDHGISGTKGRDTR
ncbi:MAG: hypothetical protein J2P54_14700, partial [Bradyrhizobiaceae bacterium]|nr:hypothetical protein [Bradyrhizobiaceae bacterium]